VHSLGYRSVTRRRGALTGSMASVAPNLTRPSLAQSSWICGHLLHGGRGVCRRIQSRQVLAAGASWLGETPEALPQKLAIVIGTESTGVSRFILDNCDRRVYLPQNGAGSDRDPPLPPPPNVLETHTQHTARRPLKLSGRPVQALPTPSMPLSRQRCASTRCWTSMAT
jgi:hypothetical protein